MSAFAMSMAAWHAAGAKIRSCEKYGRSPITVEFTKTKILQKTSKALPPATEYLLRSSKRERKATPGGFGPFVLFTARP
jgi:hypothetical protein